MFGWDDDRKKRTHVLETSLKVCWGDVVIHRNGRVQFNNGIKSFGLSKHLHGFVTFVCGPFSMFGRRGGLATTILIDSYT